MSWPGFYSLSAAWMSLLLIPLVLFYFLKLKRPRLEIPSLVLWDQVINDQRVNSPFQKFKRNLLLLLQLLLLACLVLAAMQPFVRSGVQRVKYLPVMIDTSASMGAKDLGEQQSRLQQAKARASQLIEDLLPDQRMSIITFSSTARRVTGFTDNKRLLRAGLDQIEATDLPSRIENGLRMTQALSQTVPIETVILYSDGNLPDRIDFDLPFDLQFHRIGKPLANLGITGLSAERSDLGRWHVFVEIMASVAAATGAQVQLMQENKVIADDNIQLEAGQTKRLMYQVTSDSASQLEVRIQPEGNDALDADNRAQLLLPPGRLLTIYCSQSLTGFRHALRTLPGIDIYPKEGAAKEGEAKGVTQFDLAITDQEKVSDVAARVEMTVGVVPTAIRDLLAVETGSATVVDWQRNSLLLQHVQLTDVLITDQIRTVAGKSDGDYESLGYKIIAHGNTGPLILEHRGKDRLQYHILFHTDRSTLGFRVAFPILVANVVRTTLRESALSEVRATRTGVLPAHSLDAETVYSVVGPGTTQKVSTGADGLLSGIAAPRAGLYKILQDGVEIGQVATSLLSAQESSLAAVEELQLKEMTVSAVDHQVRNDRPLWRSFALVAFFLLLAEWWYFNRPAPIVAS
jgi:Ca-activated chloride channel family protein